MPDLNSMVTSMSSLGQTIGPLLLLVVGSSIPSALIAYFGVTKKLREDRRKDSERNIRTLYYPLYDATLELYERIDKIKTAASLDWLDEKYFNEAMNNEGFAKDPQEKGYFIFSSIYLFSKLFCWLEIIHRRLGYFYEPRRPVNVEIAKAVSNVSRSFQFKEIWDDCHEIKLVFDDDDDKKKMKDAWFLHRQIQHSIGELLISKHDNEIRCISFLEFFESYKEDKAFRYWCRPLESYLLGIANFSSGSVFSAAVEAKDLRILRLIIVQYWLGKLINALGAGINFKPRIDPEDSLKDLPLDLAKAVRNMNAESTDSFFSRGVKI